MIIYINGRVFCDSITGIQKYAISVMKYMDIILLDRTQKIILLLPPDAKCPVKFKNIKIEKRGYTSGNLWEQIELPFISKDGYLLNLGGRAPILKKNQTIVIHDAAIYVTPGRFSIQFRILCKIMFFILGKTLAHIFTVSEFSKSELVKYAHIPRKKISIAYCGYEHINDINSDVSVLEKHHLINQKYILSVGGTSNKNFFITVKAFNYIKSRELKLVVVGKVDNYYEKHLKNNRRVTMVGYVTDEELMALYDYAECLVFPSIYEGFGIPPLEAMAKGCPVISSDKASLPEVCGNAVLYCNPYDAEDVANKIEKIMNDKNLKRGLCLKGYKRTTRFSWLNTAKKILDICENEG